MTSEWVARQEAQVLEGLGGINIPQRQHRIWTEGNGVEEGMVVQISPVDIWMCGCVDALVYYLLFGEG